MSNRARRRNTLKHRNRGVTAWHRREVTTGRLRRRRPPAQRRSEEDET